MDECLVRDLHVERGSVRQRRQPDQFGGGDRHRDEPERRADGSLDEPDQQFDLHGTGDCQPGGERIGSRRGS